MNLEATPPIPMPALGSTRVRTEAAKFSWLIAVILIAVFFTPTFRLPGSIPVRFDDLIIFGAGAIMAAKCLFRFSVPRLGMVGAYSLILMGTILASTLLGQYQLGYSITAKEYLDLLRPLKFLLVYWIAKKQDCRTSMSTFVTTLTVTMPVMLAAAVLELFSSRLLGDGLLVRALALFADQWTFERAFASMTQRPFATFNTPTHLGYVATMVLFLAPTIRRRRIRRALIAVCFLALVISVTRTLIFSLPLLLILHALVSRRSFKERFKAVLSSIMFTVAAVVLVAVLLPLISPVAAGYTESMFHALASGDTQGEDSITTRLGNLSLLASTWNTAPIMGVGTRELMPPFVDSELIVTFHRYGIVGIAMLLVIYPIGYSLARRAAPRYPSFSRFAILSLAVTFLYGITQGVLINSRMGVIVFLILGILESCSRTRKEGQYAALRETTGER